MTAQAWDEWANRASRKVASKVHQGADSSPLAGSPPKQGAATAKLIERTRQSKNCYCLAEAYIGGGTDGREPGENYEKFSLLFGFSPFDDGWYCASANVSTAGKSRGWSKLHGSQLHQLPEFMRLHLGSPLLAPPPARRSLAICGANSALEKIGATIRGANSVPTKMCEPTAGDKNAQRKIGSSARKSKRKNYRTIPQRRDISVDVRQVRRRPLVRVTRPVQ